MDLEAPEITKDDLLNKPVANTAKEDDEDPYFKIADPKPIESEIVVIKKSNLCFGFILFITIFLALAAGIPFIRYFPFIPPIIFLLAVIFTLCLFKKNYILKKDKDKNILYVYQTNYLCIKSKIVEVPLKDVKIECCKGGEQYCCSNTKIIITIIRIYCTDQALYDLDNSNVQNRPIQCIHFLRNCIGNELELESKILGLSVEKHISEVKDELDEGYKNGMKRHKSRLHRMPQSYPVLPEIMQISKYFYSFRNFEVRYNVLDDVETKREDFKQLDWIYSKNFDRIFIGVIKDNKSYMNKGIFEIDSLENFQFELMGELLHFQALLKDGNSVRLCTFKYIPENVLNDFIVLLNWQIIKIKKKNEQNYNSENKVITTDN